MAKLNLKSGETIDDVPLLVAAHGYVANSIELTGKDVTAMRRLFERDPAGFRAFIVQFEARFPENRVPDQVPADPAPSSHLEPDFRALAVEIVDGIRGYTFEFSSAPLAHKEDYDFIEEKLRAAWSPAPQPRQAGK